METSSQRELATSWEPLSRADARVFCFILKGNTKQTNPENHYSPQPLIKGQKSLKIKQKATAFLSLKTLRTWYFLYTRTFRKTQKVFHNVCFLHVTLRFRHFVLLRISCLRGQSRHDSRKRDVACWFRANEEQIPVDTTYFVNHVCSDYVTQGTGNTEDLYGQNRNSQRFCGKTYKLNLFTKHRCGFWTGSGLIFTAKPIDCCWPTNRLSRKHSSVWPWIRPEAESLFTCIAVLTTSMFPLLTSATQL